MVTKELAEMAGQPTEEGDQNLSTKNNFSPPDDPGRSDFGDRIELTLDIADGYDADNPGNWSTRYINLFNAANKARAANRNLLAAHYFDAAKKLVKTAKMRGEKSRLIPVREVSTTYMKIMCMNAAQSDPQRIKTELHDLSFSINEFLQNILSNFPEMKEDEDCTRLAESITTSCYVDMDLVSKIVKKLHLIILRRFITYAKQLDLFDMNYSSQILYIERHMDNIDDFDDFYGKLQNLMRAFHEKNDERGLNEDPRYISLCESIENLWTLHFFLTRYGLNHQEFYSRCTFQVHRSSVYQEMTENSCEGAQVARALLPDKYVQNDETGVRQFLDNQTQSWLSVNTDIDEFYATIYVTGDSEERRILFRDNLKQRLEGIIRSYVADGEESNIHAVDFENSLEKLATYYFAVAWDDIKEYKMSVKQLRELFRIANEYEESRKIAILICVYLSRLAL